MAESGISAASFDFYEGIRILLPGALAVGLFAGATSTFEQPGLVLSDNTFGAVIAVIIVGLLFYFVDVPAKAAAYFVNLPTDHLERWGATTRDDQSLLNVYFVMFDEDLPAGIRARALYMDLCTASDSSSCISCSLRGWVSCWLPSPPRRCRRPVRPAR